MAKKSWIQTADDDELTNSRYWILAEMESYGLTDRDDHYDELKDMLREINTELESRGDEARWAIL